MMYRLFFALTAVIFIAFSVAPVDLAAQTNDAKPKPKPFPEFSAKRQKPPKSGSRKRITVQITPQGPKAGAIVGGSSQGTGNSNKTPKSASYGWFWDSVPTELAKSSGRYQRALNRLSNPPAGSGVRAPRLQTLHSISQSHGIDILKATIGKNVSPALVLAVIAVESAGKTDAVSSAGAQGLMQLMPATATRFGVSDASVAAQNISGGVAYLDWLMGEFSNDPVLVLAAYNAGEGAVRKNNGVPPYAETRDYVPKVLAAFQVARGLCVTPPQLASDGCVFKQLGG
ncbi:lytic transglycosylase domain-containing protein [Planktotalea sp.]|uniref:lytic transglycosylase domain-containing protein n=1 Tax=Planktotalea sp. TaxID=2029877 RepID=UPI00329A2267